MRHLKTLLFKELRELLRDTHVLTLSIGFPFLFYPLLVWGILQAQMFVEGMAEASPPRIEVQGPADVSAALTAEPVLLGSGGRAALESGDLDALVVAQEHAQRLEVEIFWRSIDGRSSRAKALAVERLEALKEDRLVALAAQFELQERDVQPFAIEKENTAKAEAMTTFIVSRALPTMLISVMLMAALYPAVEVVVGERERKTLETSLVTAPRRGLVIASKALAVLVTTLIAVFGNLVAMGLTVLHVISLSDKIDASSLALKPLGLLEALPVAVVSCAFASVMMVVSVLPCRTFKAGQNLGSVTMIVGLGLGGLAFIPGTELTLGTALLPLSNSALVMRDAINGSLDFRLALVVLVELIVLTGALGWVGLSVVNSEGYAIDGQLPGWLKWTERLR